MCRLLALTTTDIDATMRRLFFHQLMLISNADGQRDGAGVTDGSSIFKSHHPYMNLGGEWIDSLNPVDTIWMGHVRSASSGTDLTPFAAHPFRFRFTDNTSLYATHNGFIRDMPKPEGDEPRSDSYQAFKKLTALLDVADAHAPTRALMQTWMSSLGIGSEWTCMIQYQQVLHVLRGNRPMYYMKLNNGYVFNTSNIVLLHFKEWLHNYWHKRYTLGRIEEMPEFQILTTRPGSHDIALMTLQKPEAAPNYNGMFYQLVNDIVQLVKA